MSKGAVLIIAVLAGLPGTAAAQILGPEVFAGGGPLLSESGFAVDAGLALRVFPAVAVFGQVHHAKTNVPLPERTDTQTAVLAGVRLTAFGFLPLSPYVLGAYGRGWVRGLPGDEAESATLHLGGGARLKLSSSANLYAEARVTLINNTSGDADLSVPLTVGLVLKP